MVLPGRPGGRVGYRRPPHPHFVGHPPLSTAPGGVLVLGPLLSRRLQVLDRGLCCLQRDGCCGLAWASSAAFFASSAASSAEAAASSSGCAAAFAPPAASSRVRTWPDRARLARRSPRKVCGGARTVVGRPMPLPSRSARTALGPLVRGLAQIDGMKSLSLAKGGPGAGVRAVPTPAQGCSWPLRG